MIWQGLITFINLFLKAVGLMLQALVSILPPSPFQALSNLSVQSYLPALNWIIPVSEILAILQLWIVAVSVFYLYSIVLRWAKAIG